MATTGEQQLIDAATTTANFSKEYNRRFLLSGASANAQIKNIDLDRFSEFEPDCCSNPETDRLKLTL